LIAWSNIKTIVDSCKLNTKKHENSCGNFELKVNMLSVQSFIERGFKLKEEKSYMIAFTANYHDDNNYVYLGY
jgi:hypothetical protein